MDEGWGSVIGGVTQLGGSIINATTAAKNDQTSKDLLQMQINANLAAQNTQESNTLTNIKEYEKIAMYCIGIFIVFIIGLAVYKKIKSR
jgi:hypothetical protein